ncbi:peptidase inhibitor family I36 protein [[Kitasatospora] papulosa]|uniref:peptidase inhibitor family I36 protein n=1 Tax=[Kitasatospora] papulosa TaxID=1464011 RepID=UPI0036A97F12
MSRTRTTMIAGAAMAVALTLGACSGEGSNNASDGRNSSEVSLKDGLDQAALPAESVAPVGNCTESQTVCLYRNVDYKEGGLLPNSGCIDDLRAFIGGNDTVSSVVNNSSNKVRLYEGVNHSGRYIEIEANSASPNLHVNVFKVFHNDGSLASENGEFNDVTSSVSGCQK